MNAVSPSLARTRSPHSAHYRMETQPIRRSEGRSVVAAALYRAGERGTDHRLGKTFDYSRKGNITAAFVVAPPNAPAWALDREKLWNAVEAAEKRSDAQVGREVLISLPRELPRDQWEPLIRRAIEPYVRAGCVVDCAIHMPDAADGVAGGNPHAHILITPRAIGPDGFARTKCAEVEAMFASGGRYGGKRGDALTAERQRWAAQINDALRAVGSTARADHRSRRARGEIDPDPEPTYGEKAAARHRRTKKPSQNQQIVGGIRHRRRAESVAIAIGVEMAQELQRTSKVPYQQTRQDVKTELLRDRIPDLDVSKLGKDDIYRVDISSKIKTVVQMRDDSIVEMRGQRLYVYGSQGGTAETLADAIARANGWAPEEAITRLPPSVRMSAPEGKYRRRAKSEDELERLVAYWQQAGYTDVSTCKQGVWVTLGSSRLLDSGDRVTLHGPITDDALRAMVAKAKAEWGGKCEINGSEDFKARIYLEACRQGVEIVGGYDPPSHVRAQAEAERKARDKESAAVATVADRAEVARDTLAFLRGSSSEAPTKEIQAHLESLRKKELAALSSKETWEIVPLLAGWQASGEAILQQEAAVQAPTPKPGKGGGKKDDDDHDQDAPSGPALGRR